MNENPMITEARECATQGAAKAFLRQITDSDKLTARDPGAMLERYKEISARAALVGCHDELLDAEREMWRGLLR